MAWKWMSSLETYQGTFHLIVPSDAFLASYPFNTTQIPWTINIGTSDPSSPDYAIAVGMFNQYYSTATDLKLLTAGDHNYMPLHGGYLTINLSGSGNTRTAYIMPKDNSLNQITSVSTYARTTWSGYEYVSGMGIVYNESTEEMYIGYIRVLHGLNNNSYSVQISVHNDKNMWSSWYNNIQPDPGPGGNPYGDDDYTQSSGGDGDHDDTSDTILQDAIPIAAATRTGMCTAYVPDWGEIRDVASALLDPNIFQILAQNVVKFSDVIIGLSVFPCTIPATYTGVVKGNVVGIEIGTGVVSHIADDQYVEIDCGDLAVEEYWGNCLDYNPYTKISIFLPFCGTYELDADEIMGRTLNVSYRIDIMSGACLATIKIEGSVFYQYSGQCSAQIPLSSVSFDQFLSSMINLGVATATGVGAIGAAGAAVGEAETAFAASAGSASGGTALMEAREHLNAVKTQSANSIADATVGAVMGSKGFYTHAGAMSGSPGFLGVRTPYLIIKRPEQLIPSMYGKFHGYPCNTTAVLEDLVGYTEVGDIRLNIPEATVEEILECEQLLKGGVVI